MTHKRIRRTIKCICPRCLGSGFQATKHGPQRCTAPGCVNGEVERWLVEFVNIEEGGD